MSDSVFTPLTQAKLDWQDGVPASTTFDDSYFSRDDGLAESDYVFLQGNRLTERFQSLPEDGQFVVGETGFGTGLNFLLAARLFVANAPASSRLHFFSVEGFPLTPQDLQRAHQSWPELASECAELQANYPPSTPGFHRRWLFNGRVSLTLAQGQACAMLEHAGLQADAWFLDGFAPSRNSDMWQPRLYQALASCSRAGATLATFTAAGQVRRDLAEAGFQVTRIPGHGRKRHMLTGKFGDQRWQAQQPTPMNLTIAGAGLAGATCARALAERGHQITVLDPTGIASGASGNLAGVVYTSASAHPTPQNRFYQSSFLQALHWFERYGFPADQDEGVLAGLSQYAADERHRLKAVAALKSGHWPDSLMQGDSETGELHFSVGGCISPPAWCRHLLAHPHIQFKQVGLERLHITDEGIEAHCDSGEKVLSDQIILANEAAALPLLDDHAVTLKRIRGQVTQIQATPESNTWQRALCHRGYLSPAIQGQHCVGATFNLHHHDPAPRESDDRQNLDELRQFLPQHWQDLGGDQLTIAGHRVGFRCQSPDFLPLAGRSALDPRVWLSVAHGSRGITGSTLAAELIAAAICHEPCPTDSGILSALDPQRFLARQRRQQQRKSS